MLLCLLTYLLPYYSLLNPLLFYILPAMAKPNIMGILRITKVRLIMLITLNYSISIYSFKIITKDSKVLNKMLPIR